LKLQRREPQKTLAGIKLLEVDYCLRLIYFCHFYEMTAHSACDYIYTITVETRFVPFTVNL